MPSEVSIQRMTLILTVVLASLTPGCSHNTSQNSLDTFVPRGELWEEQTFGVYTIRTYYTNEGSFEILKANRRVFGQHGRRFSIGGFSAGPRKLPSFLIGHDVTGDGNPNVAICEWTGGAHCCFNVFLFEIGDRFRHVATIYGKDSIPRFDDIDGDSVSEVIIHDWTYAYWPQSFAGSPAPRVILRWDGKAYTVAFDMMRHSRPSMQDLEVRAAEIRKRWGQEYNRSYIPVELWGYALELMYGGHEDLGWQFIEMGWSEQFRLDSDLLEELQLLMGSSPYWRQLQRAREVD